MENGKLVGDTDTTSKWPLVGKSKKLMDMLFEEINLTVLLSRSYRMKHVDSFVSLLGRRLGQMQKTSIRRVTANNFLQRRSQVWSFDGNNCYSYAYNIDIALLITITTENSDHSDNSEDLMFMIDEEEKINLEIKVEQTKTKNNTITMISETKK